MSGGWIKWEKDLRDDPRVIKMASALRNALVTQERIKSSEDVYGASVYVAIVLGGLAKLWSFADTHIRNDDTLDLGVHNIDQIVGIQGFSQILPKDWLVVLDTETVQLPDFHNHNGTKAKKKALTQKRVSNHREKVALKSVSSKRNGNADVTLNALPDQDQDQDQDQDHSHTGERGVESESEREIRERIDAIKDVFPKAARQDWITAEKLIRNLVRDGTRWEVIEAGVMRYRKLCDVTRRQAQNPGLWFGAVDRPWLQSWDLPPAMAGPVRQFERAKTAQELEAEETARAAR